MLGYMTIGLAVVSAAPASFAQDSRVLGHCKAAETGMEAEERQTPGSNMGVVVVVPIGRVCVGPEAVDGESSYVRRTTAKEGMTIVEVSATPFMPVLASDVAELIARPDQPAGW